MRQTLCILCIAVLLSSARAVETIPLAGEWRFALDRGDAGVNEKWFGKALPETIKLPGTLPLQGIGDDITLDTKWIGGIVDKSFFTAPEYEKYRQPGNIKVPFWLQPDKYYAGVAWYQRDIEIPADWNGKRVVLSLERPHWETRVWIDDKPFGTQNSLATPHDYDLGLIRGTGVPPVSEKPERTGETPVPQGALTAGKHTLTIRVDNRMIIDIGENSHSISDHTQGNWNGIVGKIELRNTPPVWIEDVQVFPNEKEVEARIKVTVANTMGKPVNCKLVYIMQPMGVENRANEKLDTKVGEQEVNLSKDRATVEKKINMVKWWRWDEFNPVPIKLTAKLTVDGETIQHTFNTQFGLRDFSTSGTQFTINGNKTFIRGTLDCCIYPKTGHPPMDVEEWRRIIGVAKAHGLNLIRFHSWCPPEAAFQAADELGFYFHVEACSWANQSTSIGDGKPVDKWIYEETDRILKYYGNHPSFVLMPYGNEPGGKGHKAYLAKWVDHYKALDNRRLFTSGAGWPELPENQWHCVPGPRVQGWGQGLKSRINAKPPETMTDYRDYISKRNVPVVSHEIGQWCVYPNFDEIKKYTGYLKPKNFEIFRDTLAAHGMLDQAHDFLMASGKLQTLCYKEEIESALRTPGMAGFELLDLHDFPGQGSALVGVLDPFWEEKGYVSPKEYSRFCNSVVPLARLPKRVFTTDEKLEATLDIANFGARELHMAIPSWKLVADDGNIVVRQKSPTVTIPVGNATSLGQISTELKAVPAGHYKLIAAVEPNTFRVEGGIAGVAYAQKTFLNSYENDWDIWVYPPKVDTAAPAGVKIVESLDAATVDAGGNVLLLVPPSRVKNAEKDKVILGFSSIFWNTAWTHRQAPTTLGILCDPKHPALADFPTDFHSNWQWWYLITRAAPMILDELPPTLRPTVQVIDDWFTARKLGLVFEANVGKAKVVVCSIALDDSNPVARQMRASLLKYMAGDKFAPKHTLELPAIEKLFRGTGVPPVSKNGQDARSSTASAGTAAIQSTEASSEADGYPATNATDGAPDTLWHTPWEADAPKFPHHLIIELAKSAKVAGVSCLPRQDNQRNGWIKDYAVHVSADGKNWGEPVAKGTFKADASWKEVKFASVQETRFVKLVALSSFEPNKPYASLAEIAVDLEGATPRAQAAEAQPAAPAPVKPALPAVILTPPPPAQPRINGPKVYGARPGHPFLYRIPCTGERPMTFAAENLPESLKLDSATGIITGETPVPQQIGAASSRGTGVPPVTHRITLIAKNAKGECKRELRLVVGDKIALAPPMGFNHWYAHYNRITDAMMREAADIIVSSGMADAGYQYVNVDDCWMNAPGVSKYQTDPKRVGPLRDALGNMQPNVYFPNMKALADYIHAKGLKAGLYTSPGAGTCAGFCGSYEHEAVDAKLFADWGFDFLKYDWCSYSRVAGKKPDLAAMQKPYKLMGDLLKAQKRDIVYNLCQYGMGDVWKWGGEVGGHAWRTGGDLGFELGRIFEIALKNCVLREYNKPGEYNDPDYVQIGWIGAQKGGTFEMPHPCPLAPEEQRSFMSLWCLMAAPIFYSGDMTKLDAYTLSVLCNPEAIEVNQDPLCECAQVVGKPDKTFVLVKNMEDGSKAVGLCNRDHVERTVSVALADLGLTGKQRVRDLWRQKDMGVIAERCDATVPARGVVLLRLFSEKP